MCLHHALANIGETHRDGLATMVAALIAAGAASGVHAQTITTAAVTSTSIAVTPVPVGGAWALALLGILLLAAGVWMIRSGHGKRLAAQSLLALGTMVGVAGLAGYNPSVLPSTPLPDGATPCAEGLLLDNGASCVVNVAAMCAQIASTVPVLTNVSRATCDSTGAKFVNVMGTGLANVSSVMFGSTPAPAVTAISDSLVKAALPTNWSGGTLNITLTTPGGTSAPLSKRFNIPVSPQFCAGGPTLESYGLFSAFATSTLIETSGICVLCSVTNPAAAVNNENTSDYSILTMPVGMSAGSVAQILIAPQVLSSMAAARRIGVIVNDDSDEGISASKLASVDFTAMLGASEVSTVNGSSLSLLALPELSADQTQKMLVMDAPNAFFDRIRVRLKADGDNFLRLRIYGAFIEQAVQ